MQLGPYCYLNFLLSVVTILNSKPIPEQTEIEKDLILFKIRFLLRVFLQLTEDVKSNSHLLQDEFKQSTVSRACPSTDRLVGLVVKASASRAEGPGFESRLRRDFFGVESCQ